MSHQNLKKKDKKFILTIRETEYVKMKNFFTILNIPNMPDSNRIWLLKSLLLSSSSPWYFGCISKVNIWFIFSIWFKSCILCTVINYTNNIFTASFFKIIITFFFFCFSFEASFVNCDLAFVLVLHLPPCWGRGEHFF